MRKNSQRKVAHPNTYLIGNILLLLTLWLATTSLIWSILPIWWGFRLVLALIVLIVLAYLEHHYLTGIVGRFVERFFPDEATTDQYRQSEELLERVRRRGHW
jgi:hypothetical protein